MKLMMLGPGPDRIGKSGEWDRFAVQGIRFLKKAGHEVVWVDDNPTTMASALANRVYLEPLTLKRIEKIIEQERPDGLMYGFGGCLATHLVIFLDREGVLDRYNVKVLGTEVPALKRLMNAESFKRSLRDRGVPFMDAVVVDTVDECLRACRSLGFPLILRPSFALEGIGGYLAYNMEEAKQLAHLAMNLSPVEELLLERAPADWVQFALELVHDRAPADQVHPVGTFEALAMGVEVHPANSLVLSPSPTLQGGLLEKALAIATQIGSATEICGSFQVRYALSPGGAELIVLRVIHGLNRFSSLFSVFRSIPLAELNAGLGLGLSLEEMGRAMGLSLPAPGTLEVMLARAPVFPAEFQGADILDSTVRSIGSAIFLGTSPLGVIGKALDFTGVSGLFKRGVSRADSGDRSTVTASWDRLLDQIRMGERGDRDVEKELPPGINPAILPLLTQTVRHSRRLVKAAEDSLPDEWIRGAKTAGFSDEGIASLSGTPMELVRKRRQDLGLDPSFITASPSTGKRPRDITFLSYGSETKAPARSDAEGAGSLLVLGPGPFRIGWGSEVDKAMVQTMLAWKALGKRVILLNNNPDALSFDEETADLVCSESQTLEAIEGLIRQFHIQGIVHQFCLDLPQGLEMLLGQCGVRLLGTPLASLRQMKSLPDLWNKLRAIGAPLLSYTLAGSTEAAVREATNLGFPLLVRLTDRYLNPEARVVYESEMLDQFLGLHGDRITEQTPLFMEVFQEGMVGAQVVALSDGTEASTLAFIENVEEYGVHSGDCASTLPALSIGELVRSTAEDVMNAVVRHFQVVGHLQLQLAIKGRNVYVTGLWPYPGWNTTFFQKAFRQGIHPWVARLLLGEKMGDLKIGLPDMPRRFFVKESVFPFSRFPSVNPVLSPQMQSTGQVLGLDDTFAKAYYKSQMAVNPKIPERGKIFLSARDTEKEAILEVSEKLLSLGFSLVSTEGTAKFLATRGLEVKAISKVSAGRPNVIDLIINGEISLVINIPGGVRSKRDEQAIYRATVEHSIPLITTTSGAYLMIRGMEETRKSPLSLFPVES